MSEECTHDCSTCGKSCGERKAEFSFAAPLNAAPPDIFKKSLVVIAMMNLLNQTQTGTTFYILISFKRKFPYRGQPTLQAPSSMMPRFPSPPHVSSRA